MKFALTWLKDYLETTANVAEICDALNAIGLEVEGVEDPAEKLAGFRIAHVLTAARHPDADKLQVLTVDSGDGQPFQVVCGAPNARPGMKGVLGLPGAVVPANGMVLRKSAIRGIESNGMMCSTRELELGEDHDGIIELPADAPVGTSFADYHGADPVIEVAVTPNRPDCMGVYGIARDLAAKGLGTLKPITIPAFTASGACPVEIRTDDPEGCPAFYGRVISGITNGASPDWLQARLKSAGQRPISLLVDLTNYLMLGFGRPAHAYDLAKLSGVVVARRAKDGEQVLALNEKTYTLDSEMVVIADESQVHDIAGIMGGEHSGVSEGTTDVLLESAQFAPLVVRAAARGLALASPSSYRFERTPDPAMVEWASRRAAALILELAGGRLEQGVVEAGRLAGTPAVVPLGAARVAEVLGIGVTADRQREILTGLGFVEEAGSGQPVRWRAPSWRRDVHREIDLIEEIARIEGYDCVPENVAIAARPVEWSAREVTVRRAGDVLVGAGFCEAMTRSVVPTLFEECASPWGAAPAVSIAPALVRGADRLRRTLLPSLLEARAGNVSAGSPHGNLFEVARAYVARPAGGEWPAGTSPLEEPLLLGIVSDGDFFRAKGLAEAVLGRLGIEARRGDVGLQVRPLECDLFSRGRAAELVLEREGFGPVRIGVVGEVAAKLLDRLSLGGPVAAVELRLDAAEFAVGHEHRLRRPSDFPAMQRDLNLVVDEQVAWGAVAAAIAAGAGEILEDCRLVEVWRDAERLGPGKKSFVVSLRLRSTAGTLSGEAAARAVEAVLTECRRSGAVLRG
jgi:phenylalanyl-tRNA synthetase beta chain